MPLRDHFRSPLEDFTSWDGFHGQWPAMIVVSLNRRLPPGFVAAPRIHLGSTDLTEQDAYEVRVYATKHDRRLVAVIEIVSPANKDRPEQRRAFVAKCEALLQNQVSVTIIDLVTTRNFNLYGDVLNLIDLKDSSQVLEPSALYAAACRITQSDDTWFLEAWAHPLQIGQALPTLPLWLAKEIAVPLELEDCYEETCRALQIP